MNKKNMTAFERALTEATLVRHQKALETDTEPVQFSPEHQAVIADLTKKTSRKTWRYTNTVWKRMLIAAVLMLLLAATACATIPALREGLIRFFTHDDGIAFHFDFTQEDVDRAPKEIEVFYVPSYIPSQYSLVDEQYIPSMGVQVYTDSNEMSLVFQQLVIWMVDPDNPGAVIGISADISVAETAILKGYEVKVVRMSSETGETDKVFYWTDRNYLYCVSAPNLSNEDMEQIIDSMVPLNR